MWGLVWEEGARKRENTCTTARVRQEERKKETKLYPEGGKAVTWFRWLVILLSFTFIHLYGIFSPSFSIPLLSSTPPPLLHVFASLHFTFFASSILSILLSLILSLKSLSLLPLLLPSQLLYPRVHVLNGVRIGWWSSAREEISTVKVLKDFVRLERVQVKATNRRFSVQHRG